MTEKMPSSTRFGSRPSALQDAVIFVGREAVLGDDFGGDAGSFEDVHAGPLARAKRQTVKTPAEPGGAAGALLFDWFGAA